MEKWQQQLVNKLEPFQMKDFVYSLSFNNRNL
jgi:hypothetical protein